MGLACLKRKKGFFIQKLAISSNTDTIKNTNTTIDTNTNLMLPQLKRYTLEQTDNTLKTAKSIVRCCLELQIQIQIQIQIKIHIQIQIQIKIHLLPQLK